MTLAGDLACIMKFSAQFFFLLLISIVSLSAASSLPSQKRPRSCFLSYSTANSNNNNIIQDMERFTLLCLVYVAAAAVVVRCLVP